MIIRLGLQGLPQRNTILCILPFLLSSLLAQASRWTASGDTINLPSSSLQPPILLKGEQAQRPFRYPPPSNTQGQQYEGSDISTEAANLSATISLICNSLGVMQSEYFELWQGTWPAASDWIAAVMGTHLSATLITLTEAQGGMAYAQEIRKTRVPAEQVAQSENTMNKYFTQTLSFYFGQNWFSLRMQAYDDMLWVVLGWLESIKFINLHPNLHYVGSDPADGNSGAIWYGQQFIPPFAHRARVFYDIASRGWDTSMCGGGMIWNPHLRPYKNAITNQLYIAASVSMYLYFPGDTNPSPFVSVEDKDNGDLPPAKAHDLKYLIAAIEAYEWLKSSNMTNDAGLFVDGFHVHGWQGGRENKSTGTGKCDIRDEKVYTYNQGVLLSGLRGLWDATCQSTYLDDGHRLIQNVINATGWPVEDLDQRWKWQGIGRNGILEEACDIHGNCSQDGQTFKGIFFLHLTSFCAPLPEPGQHQEVISIANAETAGLHRSRCSNYLPWIRHNAAAAYFSRDDKGRYGMWWGRKLYTSAKSIPHDAAIVGTDYRNEGVPINELWRLPDDPALSDNEPRNRSTPKESQQPLAQCVNWDPNDRGRGRTVETQSGGLAVMRALWGLSRLADS